MELRRDLLDRLGHVRCAARASARSSAGRGTTAATLGPILVQQSGLTALRESDHPPLRATGACAAGTLRRSLRCGRIARRWRTVSPAVAADIERRIEQLEATTVQFAQVRAAHLVGSGAVNVTAGERGRTGAAAVAGPARVHRSACRRRHPSSRSQSRRWRASPGGAPQAGDPLADPTYIEVCDVAARTLEQIYGCHPHLTPPSPAPPAPRGRKSSALFDSGLLRVELWQRPKPS